MAGNYPRIEYVQGNFPGVPDDLEGKAASVFLTRKDFNKALGALVNAMKSGRLDDLIESATAAGVWSPKQPVTCIMLLQLADHAKTATAEYNLTLATKKRKLAELSGAGDAQAGADTALVPEADRKAIEKRYDTRLKKLRELAAAEQAKEKAKKARLSANAEHQEVDELEQKTSKSKAPIG